MEVIRHDKVKVTRFENPFKGSNTYLIEIKGTDKVWLVDIGDSTELYDYLEGKNVIGIFLTHSHFDHIFGIKSIQNRFPNVIIYGKQCCLQWLSDDKRNYSYYYEHPLDFAASHAVSLNDDDMIELSGGIAIRALHTPGHSEDSVSYQLENMIFSGDSYIPNEKPVTKLKGGNKELYLASLKKIKQLLNNNNHLLPGHGRIWHESEIVEK